MLRYLLFDLDNTLYSESLGLERAVGRRITEVSAAYLGLSPEETLARRKPEMARYGTTLEWLMAEHGFTDVEGYFAAVHPEDEAEGLPADPALGRLLDSLPLPKAVFTNSPREHADRFLARLGIADRFEAVYDIRFNGLRGKPHRSAVERVCAACGVSPAEALLVDDHPSYVRGFDEAGGLGILLDEGGIHGDLPHRRIRSLADLPRFLASEGLVEGHSGPGPSRREPRS